MEDQKNDNKNAENSNELLKGKIKGLNLFTVLHAFWILEIYYLGLNSLWNIVQKFNIKIQMPVLAEKWNSI